MNYELLKNISLTLLHSLWQGSVIFILLQIVLKLVPAGRAELRYRISLAAFLLIVLAAVFTFGILDYLDDSPAFHPVETVAEEIREPKPSVVIDSGRAVNPDTAELLIQAEENAVPAVSEDSRGIINTVYLIVVVLWSSGILVFLSLLFIKMKKLSERIVIPSEDPAVIRLIRELSEKLKIKCRSGVFSSDKAVSAHVIGIFRPVIIVPLSIITGTEPDLLRAVLGHELAHIKRYDPVINMVQLIIERLLFFNPAVWLVSSQVRLEREAACDMTAAGATGLNNEGYANMLVESAKRTLHPEAYAAVSMSGKPGEVLQRLRRLADPAKSPKQRSGIVPFLCILLGVFLLITAGCLGAKATVKAADKLIEIVTVEKKQENPAQITLTANSPEPAPPEIILPEEPDEPVSFEEAVEVMVQASTEHSGDFWVDEKYGSLYVEAGKSMDLVLENFNMNSLGNSYQIRGKFSLADREGFGSDNFYHKEDNIFSLTLDSEAFYLEEVYIAVDGYKPLRLGYDALTGMMQDDRLVVKLEKGIAKTVRITDESGNPVQDALVYLEAEAEILNSMPYETVDIGSSGGQGDVIFSNVNPELPYRLRVSHDDYKYYITESMTLKGNDPLVIALEKSRGFISYVVDSETGRPVADAEVAVLTSRGNGTETIFGFDNFREKRYGYARTDFNGMFSLSSINTQNEYIIEVRKDGYRSYISGYVRPDEGPYRIELYESKPFIWEFIGDLDEYADDIELFLSTQKENMEANIHMYSNRDRSNWEVEKTARGLIITVYPREFQRISIDIDTYSEFFDIEEYSDNYKKTDLSDWRFTRYIDVPMRYVIINLEVPGGHPKPSGNVSITYREYFGSGANRDFQEKTRQVSVYNGKIRTDIPVETEFCLSEPDFTGYYIDSSKYYSSSQISDKDEITVKITPAGLVRGTVVFPEGKSGFRFSAIGYKEFDNDFETIQGIKNNIYYPDKDSFLLNLPLSHTYVIYSNDGYNWAAAENIKLNADDFIRDAELVHKTGRDVRLKVTAESGAPVSETKVRVIFSIRYKDRELSGFFQELETDHFGEILLKNFYVDPLLSLKLAVGRYSGTGSTLYKTISNEADYYEFKLK